MDPTCLLKTVVYAMILAMAMLPAALASASTPGEMATARKWSQNHFVAGGEPFFTFKLGRSSASEVLQRSKYASAEKALDGGITERTLTWADPVTGLEIRCVGLEYASYPAVEWVLYFRNSGHAATPILDGIQALDYNFPAGQGARLLHARGSAVRNDDFAPQVTSLGNNPRDPAGYWFAARGNPIRLESNEGRSSHDALPFFNVDMQDHGVIQAIGWTGQWLASFGWKHDRVYLQSGMKRTHLKLLPGEEIRSPRILLLFWEGEWLHGQNLLRRFVLAHHSPRANGKRVRMPLFYNTWGSNPINSYIEQIKWFKDQGLPIECLWIDAGWYGGGKDYNWATQVGNWTPNPEFFPQGMAPLGKAMEEMGVGFLLWHEPERVIMGTAWAREHPEYLLGTGETRLVDLGNPAARSMVIEHLTQHIRDAKLTWFRQDCNLDPRGTWGRADAPDREGITEIKHVTGLYEVWDTLLALFPGLAIDNCAGGGQRIDLETISRSIPMWRSDTQTIPGYTLTANQTQTHGLGLWLPLSTGFCDREDEYAFRSALGPGYNLVMGPFQTDRTRHFSVEFLRRNLGQFQEVRDLFLADFYPLTEFSTNEDVWCAWQYDCPESRQGMVLAFRRPQSRYSAITAPLHALEPDAQYEMRSLDTGATQHCSGKELMQTGLPISITAQPGSALFIYRRL